MEKRQEMENKQTKKQGFDEILLTVSQSKPGVSTSFDFLSSMSQYIFFHLNLYRLGCFILFKTVNIGAPG